MAMPLPTQRLFIRVSDSTLSFLAEHGNGSVEYEPYAVRSGVSMAANLREAFFQSDLLNRSYRRVFVMVDSPTMVLPMDEDDEHVEEKYNFVYPTAESHSVEVHLLPQLCALVAYAVNKDLKMVLEDNFSDVCLLPLMAPMWLFLMRRNMAIAGRKMFVFFHDNRMEVCVFSRSRFTFVNSFEAADAHDAVYYVLGVWKSLAMNFADDELHILGTPPEGEWLESELRQFVRRVVRVNLFAGYPASPLGGIGGVSDDMIITFHNV